VHSWKVQLDQHSMRQPVAKLAVGAARLVHHSGKMVVAEEGGASPDADPLVEAVVAGEGSAVQDVGAAAFDDWKAAEEGGPRWKDT